MRWSLLPKTRCVKGEPCICSTTFTLGPEDDIARFEYLKKSARNFGSILIGIETTRPENLEHLRERLEAAGLCFSGTSPDGLLPETVEHVGHPWFIGVQFHPELKSRPFEPHPLFKGFVGAAPPEGHGPHRYYFIVTALSEPLGIDESASPAYAGFNMYFKGIGRTWLECTYEAG